MTDIRPSDRDVDRVIRSWLHEDRHEDVSRVAGSVLDQVDATPERRTTWWSARRTPVMNKFLTIGLGTAAVVVALFIGAQVLGSPNGGLGTEPTATATAVPTPEPTLEATPSPSAEAGLPSPSAAFTPIAHFPVFPGPPRPVEAGTYDLGPEFPVSVSFVVPAGWLSCVNNARLLCLADEVGEVTIDIVTNVVADPCKTTLRDPSVGPTVDDLVTAISSLPWSAVTPPTDVTVDGIRGQEFEVTAPISSACAGDAFAVWVATLNGRVHEVSPGEQNRLRILDVQGTRVVIAGSYRPGTTSLQELAEINAIIDSVRIEPPGG